MGWPTGATAAESKDPPRVRSWTTWQVAWQSLLIFVVFAFCSGLLGVVIARLSGAGRAADVGAEVVRRLSEHGLTVSLSSFGATALLVPFIGRLTRRRESRPWSFLLGKRIPWQVLMRWCAAVLALIVVGDTLTHFLGRPVVAPWMVTVYQSGYAPLLFASIVIAAPLFEELLVRGFLLGGLMAAGTRPWIAVATTSVAWAVVHLQYDWYGIVSIVPVGLLLGYARLRTQSLYPCLAMHAVGNVVASIEVLLFVKSPVG